VKKDCLIKYIIFFLFLNSCVSTGAPVTTANEVTLTESEKLDKYNEIMYRGRQLKLLGESQSAIETFTEAIELIPEKSEAYYQRGFVYYLLTPYPRKLDQAIKDLTNAIKYDPRNDEYFFLRGNIYISNSGEYPFTNRFSMSAEEYANREYSHYILNKNKSISDYTTAISLNPTAYHYFLERGTQYLFTKKWDEAIKDLKIFIENIDPGWMFYETYISDAYKFRGWAFYETGKYDSADMDFKKYTELTGKEYTAQDYLKEKKRDEEIYKERGLKR
jgi:tetratricopeptide (TPR) repeat protein